ncbi:hypothetical protein B0H16DRAFT_1729141 [Mycena metata]|uniref:Uncharacterized protein n=1 Tax=Mycena metata TaxID=1033252 RepID=A0AAD7ICQ0_9AGAR|nr:hypothetical protein B0H16DRAFT_1729141 [Mycena metata]
MSAAGIPLPLPQNFDFVAYTTRPANIPPPPNCDLSEKNARNLRFENYNKTSIAATRAYERAASSTAGVGASDVGAPLRAFYEYSEEELALMVSSKELVDAVGPLPMSVTYFIAKERMATAKKEATEKAAREKDKADKERELAKSNTLYGSLTYDNPCPISSNLRAAPIIPEIFLLSICHKVPLPLHWWMDSVLQKANDTPLSIPTITILTAPSTEKRRVVDVTKASTTLGGDDSSASRLTPSLWTQSMRNMLAAYKKLCPPINSLDPNSPQFNQATELERHIVYLVNVDIFDDRFSFWFPIEAFLRQKILANSLFVQSVYDQKVDALKSMFDNAAVLGLALQPAPALPPPSSGVGKRGAHNDGNAASGKQPRSGGGGDSRGPGAGSREAFEKHVR